MLIASAIALVLGAPLPAPAAKKPVSVDPQPTSWSNVPMPAAATNAVLPKIDPIVLPKLPFASLGKCNAGTPLFVLAGASGGDGSVDSPFGTLAEATTHASNAKWCEADLRIATGVYEMALIIDRHTTLRRWDRSVAPAPGASRGKAAPVTKQVILRGTIQNGGPYRVALESLVLEGADDVAAILSLHAKGETRLHRVTIRDAKRRGIYLSGGKLVAQHVKITGTGRVDHEVRSGVAIALTGGAHAELESVTILDAAAQALTIRGATTRVVATDLDVRRVKWHPASADQIDNISAIEAQPGGGELLGFGAILVDEGAFFVDGLRIEDAHFAGVFARRKARARIRNVVIEDTRTIDSPGGAHMGGIAIAASGESILDIAALRLVRNPWVGVFMTAASIGSVCNGLIRESPRGVMFGQFPRDQHDPLACIEGVAFVDVQREFSVASVTVPSASGGLDDVDDPAAGRAVPCPSLVVPLAD